MHKGDVLTTKIQPITLEWKFGAPVADRISDISSMTYLRQLASAHVFETQTAPIQRGGRAAFVNRLFADRLPETRPSGARIESRLRGAKRITAPRADVSTVVVIDRVTAKDGSSVPARRMM